jgi:hypothetical protein
MANLAKMAKMANISGTGRGAIFAIVPSIGGEHPEPAAIGNAFFGPGDALGFARRVEGLFANSACGGFLAQLLRETRSGGEGLTQPSAGGTDGGKGFSAVRQRSNLGVEELGGGPGARAVPDDAGDGGAGNVLQAEGEGGGRTGEIAFGQGEDAAIRVVGIGGEEETGAGGTDDADGAETAVEGIGRRRLVEMTDDDDGGAAALGGGLQGAQGVADVLIDAGADSGGEKGDEGVEDDEGGIDAGDDGVEDGEVAGEGEGAAGVGAIRDGDEEDDVVGIAAGGVDARADGVMDVVFGGEEEDAARDSRLQVVAGEGIAAGDAGGELAEEGALAEPGIAIEDGDLAGGDAVFPEPAERLGGDVAEADGVGETALTP